MNVRTSRRLMFAAAVVCMLNFTSCSKYEDGPKLSLLTKTARLTGEWEVVSIDGDDIEDGEMTIEFEKGGDFTMKGEYTFTYGSYSYSFDFDEKGEWEWKDGKETVDMDFKDDDIEDMEMEILRLTNKELVAEDEDGDEWELEKI